MGIKRGNKCTKKLQRMTKVDHFDTMMSKCFSKYSHKPLLIEKVKKYLVNPKGHWVGACLPPGVTKSSSEHGSRMKLFKNATRMIDSSRVLK